MDIGYCYLCGFFEKSCRCGRGKILLNGTKRVRISKFLSGLLRHYPEKFGIKLDRYGFADISEVLQIINIDRLTLEAIVALDKKNRFEIVGNKIRARYGHSIDIDHRWSESENVPAILYHGTSPKNVESILRIGLLPMRRREVHLSESIADAIEVGKRHSKNPAILIINAEKMIRDGYEIRKKGKVYTTDFVPRDYLKVISWKMK